MVIQSRAISRSIISEIPWNIVLNETESDGGPVAFRLLEYVCLLLM